jgi:hypothetical protein
MLGIENRIAQGEEHFHVVIEGVMVALGDPLREECPVAGRLLTVGAS